jgi:hypothetical protein
MVAPEQEALVQQLMNKNHVIFETSDHYNRTLAPGEALAGAQREQCSYLTLKKIRATASNSRRAHSAIAFILRPLCLAVECWLGLWKEGLSCLSSRCRASSSPLHSKAALLASVQHHIKPSPSSASPLFKQIFFLICACITTKEDGRARAQETVGICVRVPYARALLLSLTLRSRYRGSGPAAIPGPVLE